MRVAAADKGTGKSESITIKNEKGRLSQEDIDRYVARSLSSHLSLTSFQHGPGG